MIYHPSQDQVKNQPPLPKITTQRKEMHALPTITRTATTPLPLPHACPKTALHRGVEGGVGEDLDTAQGES